jgi:hypothetical protein
VPPLCGGYEGAGTLPFVAPWVQPCAITASSPPTSRGVRCVGNNRRPARISENHARNLCANLGESANDGLAFGMVSHIVLCRCYSEWFTVWRLENALETEGATAQLGTMLLEVAAATFLLDITDTTCEAANRSEDVLKQTALFTLQSVAVIGRHASWVEFDRVCPGALLATTTRYSRAEPTNLCTLRSVAVIGRHASWVGFDRVCRGALLATTTPCGRAEL